MHGSWYEYAPRAVTAVLGLIFVSLASLTYEDEDGRIQSKLEDWWIRLDEGRTASLSWVASFVQGVARACSVGLDRVFSKRLFSARAIAVSLALSVASVFLSASILSIIPLRIFANVHSNSTAINGFVLFLRASAFAMVPALSEILPLPWKPMLPKLIRALWWLSFGIPSFFIADFLLYVFIATPNGHKYGELFTIVLLGVLAIGVLSDVAYIAFMRWILRRISGAERVGRISLAVVFQFLALAMMTVLPFYFGTKIASYSEPAGFALVLSCSVNSLDVLAILLVISMAILMLIHRLIWPTLQRLLYAVQRVPPPNRKAVMWTIGTCLLAYSYAGIPSWIVSLFGSVTH